MGHNRGGRWDKRPNEVHTVTSSRSDETTESDGVLVVSVWRHGGEGFLARLTASGPLGDSVEVVASPDDLLASVRTWVESLS
jgi:hypothetical protein